MNFMRMGWGRGNYCGDGVGMGLMSTTVSLFTTEIGTRQTETVLTVQKSNVVCVLDLRPRNRRKDVGVSMNV